MLLSMIVNAACSKGIHGLHNDLQQRGRGVGGGVGVEGVHQATSEQSHGSLTFALLFAGQT